MKRLMGQNKLGMILASAASTQQVDEAQEQIETLLRQRHRIQPGMDSDFMMRSQDEIARNNEQQMTILRNLLLAIAAISLIIGGIGIMNIMLVSVTERTREIGIRMAIGAKGRHVLLQFLFEAVTLSVVGGLIGVLVGVGFSLLFAKMSGWPLFVSVSSILLSFGVAGTVGICFGFFPALKASRLDPIEALRYE
jgi:putative ABC transport system permease protein